MANAWNWDVDATNALTRQKIFSKGGLTVKPVNPLKVLLLSRRLESFLTMLYSVRPPIVLSKGIEHRANWQAYLFWVNWQQTYLAGDTSWSNSRADCQQIMNKFCLVNLETRFVTILSRHKPSSFIILPLSLNKNSLIPKLQQKRVSTQDNNLFFIPFLFREKAVTFSSSISIVWPSSIMAWLLSN